MKSSKKVIRTIAMIAALTMTLGTLAGCGESESNETGKSSVETKTAETQKKTDDKYADTITLVWYPNESAENFSNSRDEISRLVEQATGKKVEQKLTTDYAIAIESLSSGTAQIGCVFGAEGYIQAKNANDAVDVLFVNSDANGSLDEAMYYSYIAVKSENASQYADGDSYSIDNIQGKKMSFVSNSSTSGFKVPTNNIISHFAELSLTVDDLLEGGSDMFFDEVLFGGSHPGSAYNLLSGKSDAVAFCDKEVAAYFELTDGEQSQTASSYTVRADAEAPFDTLPGESFTVISAIPVMNGPFVYNGDTLSPEDVEAIRELFTSDEVANNTSVFYPADGEVTGLFKKSGGERFVIAEDEWYDPIRNMK